MFTTKIQENLQLSERCTVHIILNKVCIFLRDGNSLHDYTIVNFCFAFEFLEQFLFLSAWN